MDIFSSTIIPTVNRSTLSRAVCSVLDQDFRVAGTEVIVVNDWKGIKEKVNENRD